jgi:hypothetical protein
MPTRSPISVRQGGLAAPARTQPIACRRQPRPSKMFSLKNEGIAVLCTTCGSAVLKFRIHSAPADSLSLTGGRALQSRTPAVARACGPWKRVRSAETGISRRRGSYRRQCLCWAKFQYRSADAVRGSQLLPPGNAAVGRAHQAKPSTFRCSFQVSGRRECASSLSAVRSRG